MAKIGIGTQSGDAVPPVKKGSNVNNERKPSSDTGGSKPGSKPDDKSKKPSKKRDPTRPGGVDITV